jgi:hypothetical protein
MLKPVGAAQIGEGREGTQVLPIVMLSPYILASYVYVSVSVYEYVSVYAYVDVDGGADMGKDHPIAPNTKHTLNGLKYVGSTPLPNYFWVVLHMNAGRDSKDLQRGNRIYCVLSSSFFPSFQESHAAE